MSLAKQQASLSGVESQDATVAQTPPLSPQEYSGHTLQPSSDHAQDLSVIESTDAKSTEDINEQEMRVTRLPPSLQSVAQNRSQLLQRFCDLHVGTSSSARRIFPYEAIDTTELTKTATRAAMDTLCIAQIATTFDDAQLMLNARTMYCDSVRRLSGRMETISLKQPNKAQLDDIIGTIHALIPCAWFRGIKTDNLEWMRYTEALLKTLEVFGWDAISMPTKRAFYYNWKYRAFFDGMIKRTEVSFPKHPPDAYIDAATSNLLIENAFDVPGILWRSDKFIKASQSKAVCQYMVFRILTEIGGCISRLKRWHLQWTKSLSSLPHYRLVNTKTFKGFDSLCGEYLNVFPRAYDFANTEIERDLRIFSICLLNLDQAILDINASFPNYCKSDQLKLQLREAERDATSAAADLCMLIPFDTQPQNMTFAAIHSFLPLHFASSYYEKQDAVRELAWCREVTDSLRSKYGIEIHYPT